MSVIVGFDPKHLFLLFGKLAHYKLDTLANQLCESGAQK